MTDRASLVTACGVRIDTAYRWSHKRGADRVVLVLDPECPTASMMRRALMPGQVLYAQTELGSLGVGAAGRDELRRAFAGKAREHFEQVFADIDADRPEGSIPVVVISAGLSLVWHRSASAPLAKAGCSDCLLGGRGGPLCKRHQAPHGDAS